MITQMCEVLFASNASDENNLSMTALDLRTGTNLMNYKGGGGVQSQSLSIMGVQYVMTANSTKPLLHVWPLNSQDQVKTARFVVPGKVNALAVSPDKCYIVAGIMESLYIWQIKTGRLMITLSKHYQPITCVKFIDDGGYFVSAGRDGNVLVWNLTKIISRAEDSDTPTYSFHDHGLPVTGMFIGVGGLRAYLYTVSLDRSCKAYDLLRGNLLLSVVFNVRLHSVLVDAMETCVYVGTGEGKIIQFRIDSLPRIKEYHLEEGKGVEFVGHKPGTAVTCLAFSIDGQTLISGGQDHQICMWHVISRQLLKIYTNKGAVTNLCVRFMNPSVFNPGTKQPPMFAEQLHRMIDQLDADENLVIEVLVSERQETIDGVRRKDKQTNTGSAPVSHAPAAITNGNNAANNETNSEVEKLRAEVAKLKRINRELFLACASKKLNSDPDNNESMQID